MGDMLIIDGGAIKSLGGNRIGGHAILFSNQLEVDLHNDFFTKDSDLGLEDRLSIPLYYSHGLDKSLGKRKLGKLAFKMDPDVGLWVEGVLDQRDKYIEGILKLIEEGVLGWSTGAISHLVQRVKKGAANWLSHWPVGEASLTATPAEPKTQAVALKNYEPVELKEMLRRQSLTPVERLREESERVRRHAEQTLYDLEHPGDPKKWVEEQQQRSTGNRAISEARRDWIQLRAEGKKMLAQSNENLDLSEKVLAEARRMASWRTGFHAVKHGRLELRRMAGR